MGSGSLPVFQFSSSVVSDSLRPHGLQHPRPPSLTGFRSLLKLTSIESVMPSNHLILCRPLLLPPSIFPSIRVFSNESALSIRWPKDWSLYTYIYTNPRWCSAAGVGNVGDAGSIPGLGRSPRGGNGNLLQYSCLENPRSLEVYSPWGHKELDTTERRDMHIYNT